MSEPKHILRECIAEYDAAIAGPRADQIHRVAHLILSPSNPCRIELDRFLLVGERLEEFPIAFVTLQEYALIKLVERSIEEVHSRIKRIGLSMTYCLPVYVCAKLREEYHLAQLTDNVRFYNLCVRMWRSRTLLDRILMLRVSQADLNEMTSDQKIKRIYQCDVESEFQEMAVPQGAHNRFTALTVGRQDCLLQHLRT